MTDKVPADSVPSDSPQKPLTTGQIVALAVLLLLLVVAIGLNISRWSLFARKVQADTNAKG